MKNRIPTSEIETTLKNAIQKGLCSETATASVFYNTDFLAQRLSHLKNVFPSHVLHAIAIKANPLTKLVTPFKEFGVGVEAASLPEVQTAIQMEYEAQTIVFDSPAKTKAELQFALEEKIIINSNSLEELDRIESLSKCIDKKNLIGLRINPQIGKGSILSTSVGDTKSKFGVPINERRQEIISYYKKHNWLNGIHFHIGSQGISLEQLTEAAQLMEDFILEIESHSNRKLSFIDIGGGFPVSYETNSVPLAIEDYVKNIQEKAPELLAPERKVITEFGRYVHANAAWAASKIEYVVSYETQNLIYCHLGADFILRKAYAPKDWTHEFVVFDRNGNLKKGATKEYTIAGPLCFSGDVMGEAISLPEVSEGDWIVFRDVGAYTISMWSRYNSRQIPGIYAYSDTSTDFDIIRDRESVSDVIDFWS